jgi:hypothetical protein
VDEPLLVDEPPELEPELELQAEPAAGTQLPVQSQ